MPNISIHHASCLDWLAAYEGPLFDSCVTDPPYHLTSIVKRFGGANAAEAKVGATGAYARASRGFMGKEWDGGDIAFRPETWRAIYDVLKPGAHLVAFSGSRTHHRMGVAIEDGGFEIRDTLFYCYGSGFPKSHNINKSAAKDICQCGKKTTAETVCEYTMPTVPNSSLSEAVCDGKEQRDILHNGLSEQSAPQLGRKGTESEIAGREQSGLEGRCNAQETEGELQGRQICESAGMGVTDGAQRRLHNGASVSHGADVRLSNDADGSGKSHRPQPKQQSPKQSGTVADECGSQTWGGWPVCGRCGKPNIPKGLGTALKPALEVIYLARKPLSEKSVAANVLKHGTGAINIDGCRIDAGTELKSGIYTRAPDGVHDTGLAGSFVYDGSKGRWPANLCHDGSDEVLAGFPETSSGSIAPHHKRTTSKTANTFGERAAPPEETHGDSGSAARFFYSAKAGPLDRIGSAHATVKPVDLMRWLVRMVTPPGGHILEPFAGSGKTGIAAMAEGFDCTMIELEAEHVADIERQLAYLRGEGALTFQEHNHAKSLRSKPEPLGGLFGEQAA